MSAKQKKQLESANPEQLITLIQELASNSRENKKYIDTFLAANDPDKLSKLLSKSISSFRTWVKRADPYKSREAAQKLDAITQQIEKYLVKQTPGTAVALIQKILELTNDVFAYIDDSNGILQDEFAHLYDLLDQSYSFSTIGADEIAKYYVNFIKANRSDIDARIVYHIKRSLHGKDKAKFLKEAIDGYHLADLMRCYADLIDDVDLYIEWASKNVFNEQQADIEIMKRLNGAFRPNEALEVASKYDTDKMYHEMLELIEEAHRLNGNHTKAKEFVSEVFNKTCSPDYYKKLLSYCPDDAAKKAARDQATHLIMEFHISIALDFLEQIGEVELASEQIIKRHEELDGRDGHLYRKLSKLLVTRHYFLAAVLLRRGVLDYILGTGRSKSYHYGVSDLKLCNEYSVQVDDWKDFMNQRKYLDIIKDEHRRKQSFWMQAGVNANLSTFLKPQLKTVS